MTDNKRKALDLSSQGFYVFPCREVDQEIDGRLYTRKSPYIRNGFRDASNDTQGIIKWWDRHPDALIGVWPEPSRLVILDVDVKRDDNGDITVDGFASLEDEWLSIPETFSYPSINGEGVHYVYRAPEGVNLAPAARYRKMDGIDRRSGGSYVVWNGEVPESAEVFSDAPDWLLDETEVRSVEAFDGTTQEWFDRLTPGEPNVLVRRAIDRVNFDMSHSDMVSAQHEAVRLGAEGNPGVPELLARLEEAWLDRPAENHTTPAGEWEYKFAEALASGIEKHGGAIQLWESMPKDWSLVIPSDTPDRLVHGSAGDRTTFTELLRNLVRSSESDTDVLAVLWNAPTTKDVAREWGLDFCMKRVQDARADVSVEGDNPIASASHIDTTPSRLLSNEEREYVQAHPTFIDEYLAASAKKGFVNEHYAIPAAWTLLSMAFGHRAVIPMSKPFGVNLWFLALGPSGTGKSSENSLVNDALDILFKDGETFYNLGADSSPEAIHEGLLDRDGKPSMILHDEASDFFEGLIRKDWMSGLKDKFAKWYEGKVDPAQKVRLKDLRGKSATTSFNIDMLATPDRLLGLVNTSMFETGFLARFNWTWAPPREDHDERKYLVSRSQVTEKGINPEAYKLALDLLFARKGMPKTLVAMDWTDEAEDHLVLAHKRMDEIAKSRDRYSSTEPSVTRLKETMWKCAALLALWRGENVIRTADALTAIYYAEPWFNTLFRVVEASGQGEFNQDINEIEAYIRSKEGVTKPQLLYRFRGMIDRNPRELEDRISALVDMDRAVLKDGRYYVNGKGTKNEPVQD